MTNWLEFNKAHAVDKNNMYTLFAIIFLVSQNSQKIGDRSAQNRSLNKFQVDYMSGFSIRW